jgi:hypothetical protein
MNHTKRLGRAGMLAVGLGIGATLAAASGVASADTLAPFDFNDLSISFDGVQLFQVGDATATTTAGDFGFAFADGAGSTATATEGMGDVAVAEGTSSTALAGQVGGSNDDFAFADGVGSEANAGSFGSNDIAEALGLNSFAFADGGSNDIATIVGDNTDANSSSGSFNIAEVFGDHDVASAGLGHSHDIALIFGQELTAMATAVDGLIAVQPADLLP